ncbi:hypothetical protein Dsin_004369 [Dipteronia sinensis]|uniref:MBD domain-containing protein n=1 Tax=Dipteronia sinensis TaxID=43782 RepID=A0AAE0BAQ5_9ROSI|nr:hypothetical protein Dsin_004369 [Dipteronia sinensis]
MSYRANRIRASNVPLYPPSYKRRNVRAHRPLPPQPQPQRLPPPPPPSVVELYPRLSSRYIYYGVGENYHAQTSIANSGITNYLVRQLSPETLSTLQESQRKAKRRRGANNTVSIYFDKDSRGFNWLIDGWLAEKRITNADGTYHWLYYDPSGRQYRSKKQVQRFFREQISYASSNEQAN